MLRYRQGFYVWRRHSNVDCVCRSFLDMLKVISWKSGLQWMARSGDIQKAVFTDFMICWNVLVIKDCNSVVFWDIDLKFFVQVDLSRVYLKCVICYEIKCRFRPQIWPGKWSKIVTLITNLVVKTTLIFIFFSRITFK